jgi:hypothetical protein
VAPVRIEPGVSQEPAAAGPIDKGYLPAVQKAMVATPAVAPADGSDRLEQRAPQRRVLTILRSAGADEAKAALALVERLLASHGDGLWVVGVTPIEES